MTVILDRITILIMMMMIILASIMTRNIIMIANPSDNFRISICRSI